MKNPTSSVNSLLAKLQQAIAGDPDKVPKGYLTRAQWAEKWGVKNCQAGVLLRAGVAKKIVTMQKFRIRDARGVIAVPHYKEK